MLTSLSVGASAQVQTVTAAWEANTDPLTAGYHVLVGLRPDDPLAILDVAKSTSVRLPLPVGARYYVSVRAYASIGALGGATDEMVIDLQSLPGPPVDVQTDGSGPAATVRWSPPVTGGTALSYLLSVGTAPGASNLIASMPLGATTSISGPVPAGRYYVRVQAANLVGVGPAADAILQVGASAPPASPSDLRASMNGARVTLAWSAPSGAVASYRIEAGTGSGAADIGSFDVGVATSFAADVPPGTYFVRVRAVNAAGVSGPSNEVVLRP